MKSPIGKFFLLILLLMSAFFDVTAVTTVTNQNASSSIDTTHMAELPVIELNYDEAAFNPNTYIPAQLILHSIDTTREYICKVRHRGLTSLTFQKPSIALKFFNADGEAKDYRFFGMRKDNNWVLDAMAGDLSRMRNRISFNLWMDFARKPYSADSVPDAIFGCRGRFVEVYVNGNYMGLYDFMERLDRKQLKLKKFVTNPDSTTTLRGILYKAYTHGRTPKFYYQTTAPDNSKSTYDGMQAAYPDPSEGEPFDWYPLRSNIFFLAAKVGRTFNAGIGERFDLPVFIDYMLFVDLLLAEDNISKNFYTWFYDQSSADQRLSITPWDMDATWGRDYNRQRISASTEMTDKGNFQYRMMSEYTHYQDTLDARWAELRQTWFDEDSLQARFDSCFNFFISTGVKEREAQRWNSVNGVNLYFEEQTYIHGWIHDRLAFLDSIYSYTRPEEAIRAIPEDKATDDCCFDITGRMVQKPAAQLPKGIYISGRRKWIVK